MFNNSLGFYLDNRAVALVTVLIILIVVSMVSLSSIYLMTNQARLIEKQIRRIKAFYSCRAAIVQADDELFREAPLPLTPNLLINDQAVNITHDPTSAPIPGELNTRVDYSF
jgi:Tfp pilus assembly protein PilX